MEFKIRANVVMSKDITVEADNLAAAMDKVQEILSGPLKISEFTASKVEYEALNFGVG